MDFRLYYGFRFSFAKPALNGVLQQLRQQLEEEEEEDKKPKKKAPPKNAPVEQKPTAYTMPYELSASKNQPIHGTLNPDDLDCNENNEIADNITQSPNN